jgi:hypothetical protein
MFVSTEIFTSKSSGPERPFWGCRPETDSRISPFLYLHKHCIILVTLFPAQNKSMELTFVNPHVPSKNYSKYFQLNVVFAIFATVSIISRNT